MQYTSKEVYEYVSKKVNDSIVERKKCRLSGQDFPIYKSDLEFYDKISPIFDVSENYAKEFFEQNIDVKDSFEYKDGKLKAKIPAPTLCPEERERMRFAFRNEKALYKSNCSASGKQIISIISPDKLYTVYDYQVRWQGSWNPELYAQSKDVKMFDALNNLILNVPMWNRFAANNDNSEYVNIVADSRNCYMSFASIDLEDCFYVWECASSKSCIDCFFAIKSENCYDCVQVSNCFNVFHAEKCTNCSNSSYIYNCVNCHDCLNCANLSNKSYCIENIQYTKEEYEKYKNHKINNLKNLINGGYVVGNLQQSSEDCFGNNLNNCKDCSFLFDSSDSINTKYTRYEMNARDCMDTFTSLNDTCYYMISCPNSYACGNVFYGRSLKYARYCCNCYDCSNIFGCVGLRDREYCVYNKQYTKNEYNEIVPQIIAKMIRDNERGEFFNPQLSFFGYNESIAMEFFPLSREDALKMGFKRSDYEAPFPKVEKSVPGEKLPTAGCREINEKKPEILKKAPNYAIVCEVSKKPFLITKQEIEFYIKHNLPLPTKHPNVRHQERIKRKDPTTMHLIHCDDCGEEMLSVHLPGEGKKILCEKCFYKES